MRENNLVSDINWFRNHLENKTTRTAMAAEAGVSPATITYWSKKHGFTVKKLEFKSHKKLKKVKLKTHKKQRGQIDALDVYKYGFDAEDVEEIKNKLSDQAAEIFASCYECTKDNEIRSTSYFQWIRNGINFKRRCLILNEIKDVIAQHMGLSLCN